MTSIFFVLILGVSCNQVFSENGILFPKASITRELLSLDGLWEFSLSGTDKTKKNLNQSGLYENDVDVEYMPVPASYNDISTNSKIRDYVGTVQYQRSFIVPSSWGSKRIWLRFGSVCYSAEVFINDKSIMFHEIGHLPFLGEITSVLKIGDINNITVIVNNTLTNTTIPQGSLDSLPSGRTVQDYTFDFFNYAGIDRPVILYTTPQTFIDDITITTNIIDTTGIVNYDISVEGDDEFIVDTKIIDRDGKQIKTSNGQGVIENARLWWPYHMSDDPGYMYTLKVDLLDTDNNLLDRYEQLFGIRELTWDNSTFKINGKPLYLRGFGRHEDSDIRGKGLDLPLIVRDYNLIKWTGANSYRTSHYPYAEEIMDMADRLGIMIIDEVPAVNTQDYSEELLENHIKSVKELLKRDKNRPSVIIWSVANEPVTDVRESEDYYRKVISYLKTQDDSRPVTIVNSVSYSSDYSGQFLDIICFNRYNAWYSYEGDLDVIIPNLIEEAEGWHDKYNKPVLVTEYGADTMEGLHFLPTYIWSEEFQSELMSLHFKAFDQLREKGWFIGEMIWNFADFKTKQDITRVGGNKKGIFTRQRQPKASAHLMRKRYWALAELLDNATLSFGVDNYVVEKSEKLKDEL